jgi:hypothetical protein
VSDLSVHFPRDIPSFEFEEFPDPQFPNPHATYRKTRSDKTLAMNLRTSDAFNIGGGDVIVVLLDGEKYTDTYLATDLGGHC